MTPELAALLVDMRSFCDVMYYLLLAEDERRPSTRCAHLATKARELAGRCEGAVRANIGLVQDGPEDGEVDDASMGDFA